MLSLERTEKFEFFKKCVSIRTLDYNVWNTQYISTFTVQQLLIFGTLSTSASNTTCDMYIYMFRLNKIQKCPSFT